MKRTIIMLTTAMAIGICVPVSMAEDHDATHLYRNYIGSFCKTMQNVAYGAVQAQRHGVPQDVTTGTVINAARVAFLQIAGEDQNAEIGERIAQQFGVYADNLVSRAYLPRSHGWPSPESTNMCVWTLDRCIASTGNALEAVIGENAETARANVGSEWWQFNADCQPPYTSCAMEDEPFMTLSLACQEKLGNYPHD